MPKRSPPAMPPAVLTNTPDRPSPSGEGNARERTGFMQGPATGHAVLELDVEFDRAWARLGGEVADVARLVSVRIRPKPSREELLTITAPSGG